MQKNKRAARSTQKRHKARSNRKKQERKNAGSEKEQDDIHHSSITSPTHHRVHGTNPTLTWPTGLAAQTRSRYLPGSKTWRGSLGPLHQAVKCSLRLFQHPATFGSVAGCRFPVNDENAFERQEGSCELARHWAYAQVSAKQPTRVRPTAPGLKQTVRSDTLSRIRNRLVRT